MVSDLSVIVVGLLVVFIGLIILIFCIQILSLFNHSVKKNKTEEKIENENTEIKTEQLNTKSNAQVCSLNSELIAAITAAVSCMLDQNTKFKVKRILRTNNK